MEVLAELERMIEGSGVYREFLGKLPLPFSNVYFEVAAVLFLGVYLIYRIVDGVRMLQRRKRLCRMREEALLRGEEERLLREQETEVQRGKIAAFMQFLQAQNAGYGSGRGDGSGRYDSPNGGRGGHSGMQRGIGTNRFRIGSTHSASDFEILMKEAEQNEEEK